ncbi:MAG: hypothetical protein ACP5QR_02515 [Rhizomicrobium sp.]
MIKFAHNAGVCGAVCFLAKGKLEFSRVDSKFFRSLGREQLRRLAAKPGLPSRLTTQTAQDTVARFREAWLRSTDPPITSKLRTASDQHLMTVPILFTKVGDIVSTLTLPDSGYLSSRKWALHPSAMRNATRI